MLTQLKRLGGDSLLYAFMNVGTKLIAFFMLPIYTAYLGTSQMGVLENIDAFTSMLTFLIIFGTDNALAFYYYDTEDRNKKDQFVRTVLSFRLMVSLSLFMIVLVFGNWIFVLITGSQDFQYVLYIAMGVLVLESVITLLLTYYRFEFKSMRVMVYTVLRLGMVALLSYLFLKFLIPNVEAIYYGRIISALLILLILLKPLIRFIRWKVDFQLLKQILIYAAPLVPASLSFWVISFSNRFFLSQFESLDSVGIYGVAFKFATVITLLTSSVQMAWRPYTMSIKEKPNAKDIFAKFYLIILLIGIVGLLGIATVIPYVFRFMIPDPDFYEASRYIALISSGTFLNFYYLIISVGLFIEKKTKPIAFYFLLAAGLSIVLNLLLIPFFSLWGAAAAMVVSYLFATVMIFIRSQKVYYVPVPVFKLIFLFINGFIAMLAIVYLLEFSQLSIAWVLIPWAYFIVIVMVSRVWRDIKA